MSTAFATPYNNASSTVGTTTVPAAFPYNITLTSGGGSKFPANPASFRVTICQVAFAYSPTATTSNYTVYNAHMTTTADVMSLDSLSTVEGQTQSDRVYNVGDIVELRVTAGTLSNIHTAVNNIENAGSSGQFLYNNSAQVGGSANLTNGANSIVITGKTAGSTQTALLVEPAAPGSWTQYTTYPVISIARPSDGTVLGNFGVLTNQSSGVPTTSQLSVNGIAVSPNTVGETGNVQIQCDTIAHHYGSIASSVPGTAATNDLYFSANVFGSGWFETFHCSAPDNTTGSQLNIPIYSSGRNGIVITAASGQTADMQTWKSNGGASLSGVGAAGHHYMVTQSSGGTPSGTPPAGSLVFDTSNFKLWAYTGSAWKSTTLA